MNMEKYKFEKPDFVFLLWDVLGTSGYCTANTLIDAIQTTRRMLNDMRAVKIFEVVRTEDGYLTVDVMSIHKHKSLSCINYGSGEYGLHVSWYTNSYKKLKYY